WMRRQLQEGLEHRLQLLDLDPRDLRILHPVNEFDVEDTVLHAGFEDLLLGGGPSGLDRIVVLQDWLSLEGGVENPLPLCPDTRPGEVEAHAVVAGGERNAVALKAAAGLPEPSVRLIERHILRPGDGATVARGWSPAVKEGVPAPNDTPWGA